MISYDEALALILSHQQILDYEHIAVTDTLKRVLAEDIYAPMSLPSYDNSTMDGYALRAQDTKNASPGNPAWFEPSTCLGAGEWLSPQDNASRRPIEIMTGAPIPEGLDTVIPVEKIVIDDYKIGITQTLTPGSNIRYQGEDLQKGTLVLSKGEAINPQRIMVLSGLGYTKIPVFKKATLLILATGKELVVNQPIDPRYQLYDCNTPFISSSFLNIGQNHLSHKLLPNDTDKAFINYINQQLDQTNPPTIIISTGAVSAGKYDFIPRSLKQLGAQIVFHKVAIRPGKPILFALLPNGTFYFGLPGNPSAVAAGLRFFVYPLLRQLNSMPEEQPTIARLDEPLTLSNPLCFFQKAYHYIDNNADSRIRILPGQASFMIAPMIGANAWAMISDTPSTLHKDSLIRSYPMSLG